MFVASTPGWMLRRRRNRFQLLSPIHFPVDAALCRVGSPGNEKARPEGARCSDRRRQVPVLVALVNIDGKLPPFSWLPLQRPHAIRDACCGVITVCRARIGRPTVKSLLLCHLGASGGGWPSIAISCEVCANAAGRIRHYALTRCIVRLLPGQSLSRRYLGTVHGRWPCCTTLGLQFLGAHGSEKGMRR